MFVNILKTGKGGKNQYVRLVEGYRDENGKNHNRVIKNGLSANRVGKPT